MLSYYDMNCVYLLQKLKTTIVCNKLYYISDEERSYNHYITAVFVAIHDVLESYLPTLMHCYIAFRRDNHLIHHLAYLFPLLLGTMKHDYAA